MYVVALGASLCFTTFVSVLLLDFPDTLVAWLHPPPELLSWLGFNAELAGALLTATMGLEALCCALALRRRTWLNRHPDGLDSLDVSEAQHGAVLRRSSWSEFSSLPYHMQHENERRRARRRERYGALDTSEERSEFVHTDSEPEPSTPPFAGTELGRLESYAAWQSGVRSLASLEEPFPAGVPARAVEQSTSGGPALRYEERAWSGRGGPAMGAGYASDHSAKSGRSANSDKSTEASRERVRQKYDDLLAKYQITDSN